MSRSADLSKACLLKCYGISVTMETKHSLQIVEQTTFVRPYVDHGLIIYVAEA